MSKIENYNTTAEYLAEVEKKKKESREQARQKLQKWRASERGRESTKKGKAVAKQYWKKYYELHKNEIIENTKQWSLAHPEEISKSKRKYEEKASVQYRKYQRAAKRRGIAMELTEEEFTKIIEIGICKYSGTEGKMGIDRVDNNKGYIQNNCVPCCWKCNQMKGQMTEQEFEDHITKIYKCIQNKKN